MSIAAGFLMDPLESVVVGHDTTFAILLEAQRRGWTLWVFEQSDLSVRDGRAVARARQVKVKREAGAHFEVVEVAAVTLDELDVVFLRKDPPVDVEFLHATQIVELANRGGGGPLLVNEPAGLRDANEKLFALRFPELCPETLVSRDGADLRAFLREVGGKMVVKPVDGFGGKGIFLASEDDRNLGSILETSTVFGTEAVIAQRYLPESREGDKRVLVIDGEPAGGLLRIPAAGDVRGNMAVGGSTAPGDLNDRDREICAALAPELRERGLHFCGLDVIGRWLTEVNVTSPTGIEEVNRLCGLSVESDLLDFVEARLP